MREPPPLDRFELQMIGKPLLLAATIVLFTLGLWSCLVEKRCFFEHDCPANFECNGQGRCQPKGEAGVPELGPVPDGAAQLQCPFPRMVKILNHFCVDIYEAARPDATRTSAGQDQSRAITRKGVLPWQVSSNAEAAAACQAAGKRLCTPAEWQTACQGPARTVYAYGNTYETKTCNGIDAFADWGFHLEVTGFFTGCTNDFGVFDMNGNVWEHTAGGDKTTIRGGAYNCSDSQTLHRCDYIPTSWEPTAQGFRCCADLISVPQDAGVLPDLGLPTDAKTDALADGANRDALRRDAPALDAAALDAPALDAAALDAPALDATAHDVTAHDVTVDQLQIADSNTD